jgi:ABC-type multidrug transport system fused ATPase/permease subunit
MYGSVVRKLWHILSRFHRRVYGLTATIVVCELLKLAPAAVLAVVIDSIGRFSVSQVPFLLTMIGILFVSSTLVSLLDTHIEYESANLGFDSEGYLMRRISKKLLGLPLGYHESNNTGSVVHVLQRGGDRLVELIFFCGKEMLPTLTQLLVTILVLFWVGWIPGLVFFVFVPVFGVMIHMYGVRVQPLREAYHQKMDEAAGFIGERVMNVRSVQEFSVQGRELDSYHTLLTDYILLQRNRMRFQRSYSMVRDMALNFARAAIMGVGIWLVIRGSLTPGLLVLFITLSEKANLALFRAARFYDRVGDTIEAIRKMIDILEEEERVLEKKNALSAASLEGELEFRSVSFAYGKGNEVLKDVSFAVKPKQMVAIIGRSGAGKSTIVKLLYRHFDVTQGAILVDGADIREYKLDEYRRQLASVPQDVEIFNATVRENIAFGSAQVTQDEIVKAAKTAHAHAFISQFPDGYDTLVGERGVRLSGGQRQRIGIARALLAKPGILIFDEATSSLDTESEQLIQEAMLSIAKDFTMIVIAHRLSTIERADLVVVIEEGKVVEMGSHADLIGRKGIYHQMRSLQRLGDVRS